MHSVITPAYVEMANDILKWAKEFLVPDTAGMVRPHHGEQKPGPVCPFVAPAIDNDSLYLAFHPGYTGFMVEDIGAILEGYLDVFGEMRPYDDRGQTLKAVLVVFPDIPKRDHPVLSVAARKYKTRFVNAGLMVAPFYPTCKDKTVYAVDLFTSQAPHPFIAIRQMAIHDILFLGGEEDWFKAYDLQYGEQFKEPAKLQSHDKPLEPMYQKAKEKFKKH